MRHYACILQPVLRSGLRLLSNDEWHAIAKSGQHPADAFIRKAYASTIVKADGVAGNVLDFTISTADQDRHGDTVAVNGWDVENFKQNPVVLWAHNYDMIPVGKALSIGTSAAALVSRAEFPDQDLSAFGFMVYRLLVNQYLRATSVGFIPNEWTYDETMGGYKILAQELLEYSIVPVPANPNTLQNALGKGIDLAPYVDWVERALDEIASPGIKSVNISRDVLERVMKIAKPSSSTTVAGVKPVSDPVVDPFKALLDSVKAMLAANKAAGKKGDPETAAFVAKSVHLHAQTLGFMTKALIESLGMSDDEDDPTDDTVASRGLLVRELLTETKRHLDVIAKAGARHSTGDKAMIKDIHDLCVKLGFECQSKDESDDEKAARVAREKAAELAAKPPVVDDALALEIGDDVDLSQISAVEMGNMIRDTMKLTLVAATGKLD